MHMWQLTINVCKSHKYVLFQTFLMVKITKHTPWKKLLSPCCTSPETVQLRLPTACVNPHPPPPDFIFTDARCVCGPTPARTDQNLPEHVFSINPPCAPQLKLSPHRVAELVYFLISGVVRNVETATARDSLLIYTFLLLFVFVFTSEQLLS